MRSAIAAALLWLAAAAPAPAGPPLYYQHPDGKPAYAAGPKRTSDGRAYVPVFEDKAPAPATAPSSQKAGGQKAGRILYYRNPMGLPDTSPVPKKDAMGMDYIPVRDGETADAGVVTIPPGRMQVLGVRTVLVESRPVLTRSLRATGTVQFDERGMAVVTTRVGGWVERLEVAATGDAVRRGQVLAQIYAPDLVAAEEEYLIASRMGGALAAASVQRLRALGLPDGEVARLRRTRKPVRLMPVLAPEDGVVTEKLVVQGTRVGADQPLYRTARLSPVWLIAEVQEQDLGSVQPGQTIEASFVALPGRRFEGKVAFIYPSLTADTRTGRVRIVLANPDGALRAGMFASVQIASPAGEGAGPVLAVPSSAVLDSGTRQIVLVERGEGRFEPREVRLGAQADGTAQILGGLKPGERVVVGANFLIDAESNLKAALQAFTDAQRPAAAPKDTPR